MAGDGIRALVDVGWAVADLLRGTMGVNQYRKVILPFTLLHRMDCLRRLESDLRLKATAAEGESRLAATVSDAAMAGLDGTDGAPDASGSLGGLLTAVDETSSDAESRLAEALGRFVRGFSAEVVDVLDTFDFASTVGGWQTRVCCARWCPGLPSSIWVLTSSPTRRWGGSTRNWSGVLSTGSRRCQASKRAPKM